MAGTISVTGQYTNAVGTQSINLPTVTILTPIGEVLLIALASGANTINIPAGSTFMIIQPPASNTQTLRLKGVTGDTGIGVHKTLGLGPHYLDPSDTSFCLTAGGAIAAYTVITFV
jgi:hypothetical protein